jgi:hypothetical protein
MRNVRFATPIAGKRTGITAPAATGCRGGKTVGEESPTFARGRKRQPVRSDAR